MKFQRPWMILSVAAMLVCQNAAWAGAYQGVFTGVFYGQGEGCWGGLFVRTKTIAWNADHFTCRRTTYTIIAKDLHTPFKDYDHIVFKLDHVNKGCLFPYIGLYYYLPADEAGHDGKVLAGRWLYYDWVVVGFENYKQYKTFPYRGFMDDTIHIDPMTLMYCDLPYGGKPFPYGKPLFGP
ncbi:hypothetical protein AiwAL_14445 [Acidiphilium sp. AL]|uniref:Lipoprotein n=1 Tax=Acidiphilium iwatense TaxID=768198 RepID=A0ABS9E1X3_9PROT|nr:MULTISPECIES: hypothetical protein [Acidiphilium]MCF3948348.1 hypothetical protein [Acidiphilium iwatense]MCU4161289.1 hypothetical protein [Acidiphilium sp. AL]